MSDGLQLLSIGIIAGGPEPTPIDETIRRVGILLAELQTTTAGIFERSEGELNVVFHLPGRLTRPSFRGLRTAKFSRKQKTLMVQVAVPDSIVNAKDEEFVADALKGRRATGCTGLRKGGDSVRRRRVYSPDWPRNAALCSNRMSSMRRRADVPCGLGFRILSSSA